MSRPILAAPFIILLLFACGPAQTSGERCFRPVTVASAAPVAPPRAAVTPPLTAKGLAASRWQPGLVAVWDAHQVVIRAGDASRRLPLPGDPGRVVGAAFDHDGRLHLLYKKGESGVLLSWGRGPRPSRQELDFTRDTVLLTSTRRHLVWVGQPHRSYVPPPVRASTDGGKTWSAVDAPNGGNAGLEVFVELDGGLQLMTGSEAACGGGGQHRDSGKIGLPGRSWTGLPWLLDAPYGWFLGPRGWAYARLERGEACGDRAVRLCAINKAKKLEPVELSGPQKSELARALEDWWPDAQDALRTENGRQTLLLVGELLVLLDGKKARVLTRAPEGVTALALDAGGKPYALAGGKLLRLSAKDWHPAE
jgi:hypothetical protein